MPKQLWRSIICLLVFLSLMIPPALKACSRPPGFGFIISWVFEDDTAPFPIQQSITGALLDGSFVSGQASTAGDQSPFDGTTDSNGVLSELGKATPATWQIAIVTGPCSLTDPERAGSNVLVATFQPSSTPQQLTCHRVLTSQADGLVANPSSYDTSAGFTNYTMNMTDNSEAWPRTPAGWYNFDSVGDIMQTGTIGGVTDAYNCWMNYTPFYDNNRGSALQYIWIFDANGLGIGYAQISVTNGTSNGG